MKIGVFLPECPWGSVSEVALGQGLGGRETALVQLCLKWAEAGHEVYAFVPRDDVQFSAGVKWIPMEQVLMIAPVIGFDLFVSWENVEVFMQLEDADVGTRVIEMQVAHLASPEPLSNHVHYIAALSEWAADFLHEQHPDFPREKIVVFPNGVDLKSFPENDPVDEVDVGHQFIYSSSPDRGLHHLLRMWPKIYEKYTLESGITPSLHVCYGIENFVRGSRWSHKSDADRALTITELIGQPGVIYHGKVGQDRLHALMARCDALLYPCDTMSHTETGCLVAGTPVDCPRDFALYPDGVPIEEIKVGQLVWTINEETLKFELKRVQKAWKTKIDAPIWRVTLDSGQIIEGTEEHPFMKRDGSWAELADLKPGDSLMPLYRDFEPRVRTNPNGPNGGAWKDEYREVAETVWPDSWGTSSLVVHHEDERHANTSEENLHLLTRNEHRAAHDMRGGWTKVNDEMSPEERAKRDARTKALAGKRWGSVPVEKRRLYWHQTHPNHRCKKPCEICEELYEHKVEKITSSTPGLTMAQRRSYLRWERQKEREEAAALKMGNPFMSDDPNSPNYNHKVVSVEFTERTEDVYNLEVEDNHNYVVHGVVVHNCITIVEALAAGINVVTTEADCLKSEFGHLTRQVPLPLDYEDYIDAVDDVISGDFAVDKPDRDNFLLTRDWGFIASDWTDWAESL